MSHENETLDYRRIPLYQCDAFEVVEIHWTRSELTALHDHGFSQCMVLIQEGDFENILDLGVKTEYQVSGPGELVHTPVAAKHQMRCLSQTGKTLHLYTPKITASSTPHQFETSAALKLIPEIALSQPTPWNELKALSEKIRESSVTTASPYFMNQLFSGQLPQMLLAEEILAQAKTTLATFEASPALSLIETEVIEALGNQIGWKAGTCDGITVPGGSAANFMAIHCARQRRYPSLKQTGMTGQKLRIFISSESHYSFLKAAVALGLGTESIIKVEVDAKGRMKPSALEALITKEKAAGHDPLMICATAGTTVLGAFDPIDELSIISKKYNLWLHVDAAWGGPVIFSQVHRSLVKGIDAADSVTFDAHKLLGAGLTCAFYLTPHPKILREANDIEGGEYLFHGDQDFYDRGKLSWQCGRRGDALSFWSIWKSTGTKGLGDFVDRMIKLQKDSLRLIENEPRLELIHEPVYLNVCVRIKPPSPLSDEANFAKRVRQSLIDKNLAMVNYASDSKGTFLRLILANPQLKISHLNQILQWILEIE